MIKTVVFPTTNVPFYSLLGIKQIYQLDDRVEQLLLYGMITLGRQKPTLWVYGHSVY